MSFEASEVEPLVFADTQVPLRRRTLRELNATPSVSLNAEAFLHELPTIFVEFRALLFDF
jgi:hypothetical protein